MVGAAILLAIATPVPGPIGGVVHVAPLRTKLTAAIEIGRRGVGWTCFPAGSVHWRDVSFDPNEAADAVARSLTVRGVAADVVSTADEAQGYVLSGTIRSVGVKACSAWGVGKVLGGGAKLKGRVTITIDWSLRGGAVGDVPRSFATVSEVNVAAKGGGYEELLGEALTRAGMDAAAELKPAMASVSPVEGGS